MTADQRFSAIFPITRNVGLSSVRAGISIRSMSSYAKLK
jgi:hypothetical protein